MVSQQDLKHWKIGILEEWIIGFEKRMIFRI
jgi:hypothetical protein